jgi:hypothetical protein
MRANPWLIYLGLVSVLIISLAYYRGLTSDVNSVAPWVIKLFALGQGRDPNTFQFSSYPK